MEKYVGCTVEIIYLAQSGQITRRRIQILQVRGGIVRAYCLERQGIRAFRRENILALQPLIVRAG